MDDFRMETINIVAKATPIKKNADISALTVDTLQIQSLHVFK